MTTSPSPRSKTKKRRHFIKVRFFWLLASLVGFILTVPSLPGSSRGEGEALVLVTIIFFAAIYVSQGLSRFWAMGILILLLITGIGLNVFFNDSTFTQIFPLTALLLTLSYTSVCVLGYVLEVGHVDAEHIYGAICAYVLLAMAFATLYMMLEILMPDSFSGVRAKSLTDRPWWQFFYFSFTTLSTVGYGDIVPVTMRARSFVIVEQMIGIFYVAILISRLTGMYKSNDDLDDELSEET